MHFDKFSLEDFVSIQAEIKLLEYNDNLSEIDRYIHLVWEGRMIPLIQRIYKEEHRNEVLSLIILSKSYMSLIMSVYKYYHRLSDNNLYKYVAYYKYILENIQKSVGKITWSEIDNLNSIKFSENYLVVDTFEYRYIDFGNPLYIVSMDGMNLNETIHRMFFAVTCEKLFMKKCKVQVLLDEPINSLCGLMSENKISSVSNYVMSRLQPFLIGKKRIYVCDDMLLTKYISKLLMTSEDSFLCEQIPIIFCSNIRNLVDDVEVRDVSNAYIFGKSKFIQPKNSDGILQDYLTEIPYSEREVSTIGEVLGCSVKKQKFDRKILERSSYSIIHLSTHTKISCDGNEELIVGDYNEGKSATLDYNEISNANWKNVDLVVLSACNTGGITEYGDCDMTLEKAVHASNARSCISTLFEIEDGINALFMTCFYKELKKTNRVIESYVNALNAMRQITKRKILQDQDYKNLGMEQYLKEYAFDEQPFNEFDDFSAYILDIY